MADRETNEQYSLQILKSDLGENGGGRCTRCVKLGKECVRIEEKWKFCHTAILEPSTIGK